MAQIQIVADSTCDLSPELIDKYHILIDPLCIVMDDKSYYDGLELSPAQIYEWADANKTTPKTAAVTFEKSAEILKPFMDAGDDIIFFGISEQMSTTCNVIRLLAEEMNYDKIHIINSQNLSTGIGLQVIYAAELAAKGKTVEEIVDAVNNRRGQVRASFVVDTLTYLARGGRCNAVTALLANTLKLKPEIVVNEGVMGVSKKYRGSINIAVLKYAQDLEPKLLNADPSRVFITHSGCEDSVIALVKDYLDSLHYFNEILVTNAGGVVSSHCGPGTLGVLFYGNYSEPNK